VAVSAIPLSVLDLATVCEGATSSTALADSSTLAVRADQLGYLRFWVAEHHNLETVASTTPAVLMAHLGAVTEDIRLGSGGVMLPNHAPLAIAEQFALLEALHPGRVDLGIGRAPGSDQATAAALRRSSMGGADDFPSDLVDVMGLLGDVRSDHGLWERFSATPVAGSSPLIVLLGSSDYSARLAAMLGLPFGFANHFSMGGTVEVAEIYRREFQPSVVLDEPYTLITASAVVAETDEAASYLANPGRIQKYGMRTGQFLPLMSPEEALRHPQLPAAKLMPTNALYGSPETVAEGLRRLAEETEAQELMLHIPTFEVGDRVRTLELLSDVWGIG
jgi:luciferase family oxidoreductase group 1